MIIAHHTSELAYCCIIMGLVIVARSTFNCRPTYMNRFSLSLISAYLSNTSVRLKSMSLPPPKASSITECGTGREVGNLSCVRVIETMSKTQRHRNEKQTSNVHRCPVAYLNVEIQPGKLNSISRANRSAWHKAVVRKGGRGIHTSAGHKSNRMPVACKNTVSF